MQLWYERTENNCNIVKLPVSVNALLNEGKNRVFNFLRSFLPLNIRKEAEHCLPAAFQFWEQPKAKKLLDKFINLFVFGGNLLNQTNSNNQEVSNLGACSLMLSLIRLQCSINLFYLFQTRILKKIWTTDQQKIWNLQLWTNNTSF